MLGFGAISQFAISQVIAPTTVVLVSDSLAPTMVEALSIVAALDLTTDTLGLSIDDLAKLFTPNVTGRLIVVMEPPRLILVEHENRTIVVPPETNKLQ